MNLQLNNCRGQCYDGAATMKGSRSGEATHIMKKESRAVYTHCYGHALNLACQDTIRHVKLVRDSIDTTFKISKLLKYSSKRKAQYLKIKEEMAPGDPGFHTLCPIRWTVRANSLAIVECLRYRKQHDNLEKIIYSIYPEYKMLTSVQKFCTC